MERVKADAIVSDGDGTLWRGSAAAGIGKYYMAWELYSRDFGAVMKGWNGAREVKRIVADFGADGNAEALKRFYEVLMSVGLGDERGMYKYARRYISWHRISAVQELINAVGEEPAVILSTIDGSTAARAAADHFKNIDHIISNIDLFDGRNGMLSGVRLVVRNGEEKRHEAMGLLDRLGLDPSRCAAIGDSDGDVPTLKSVGLRYASPFANEAVMRVPGIRLLRR